MDPKLDILRHLYGEGGEADLNRLLEDEALREEYEALRAAKNEVDQRRRRRPDPAVIDQIMAAAGPPPFGKRNDRPPLERRRLRRTRIFGALGSTLVVVMLVGIGFWRSSSAPEPADVAAAEPAWRDQEASEAVRPPAAAERKSFAEGEGFADEESGRRAARSRPESLAEYRRQAAREALPLSKQEAGRADLAAETGVPAWDEADEVRRLFRRVEQLEAGNVDLAWDEPPLPLEAVEPGRAGRRARGLQPATQRRLEGFPP